MATGRSSGGSGRGGGGGTFGVIQRVPTVPPNNTGSFVVVSIVQRLLLLPILAILVSSAVSAGGGAGNNTSGEAEEAAVRSGAGRGAIHGHHTQSTLNRLTLTNHTPPIRCHKPKQGRDQVRTVQLHCHVPRHPTRQSLRPRLLPTTTQHSTDRRHHRRRSRQFAPSRRRRFDPRRLSQRPSRPQSPRRRCCQDPRHELRFSRCSGFRGLCYSDKSKKAISDLQAMWIRWIDCLMIYHCYWRCQCPHLPLNFPLNSCFFN